jgi:hypothetical protein
MLNATLAQGIAGVEDLDQLNSRSRVRPSGASWRTLPQCTSRVPHCVPDRLIVSLRSYLCSNLLI